jgi:hypothetical protein
MTAKSILALDPGLTTGVSFWSENLPDTCQVFEADFHTLCVWLESHLHSFDEIVVERFIITPQTHKNTQSPWSLEVIGVSKWLALKSGRPFHMQMASAAKRFSTDDKLKAMNWYTKGQGHANDASRHLLLRLVSTGYWNDAIGPKDHVEE